MKLGVLIAGRRPADVAPRLAQARDAGFSLCQLSLHQTGFGRQDLTEIADAMLEYGIRPVAVGCYVNPLRPDDAGFMGATRDDLMTLLQSLDIVGARRVVIASGSCAAAAHEAHPDNSADASLEALCDFLADVVAQTAARNYTLVIEPWTGHVLSSSDRVIALHSMLDPRTAGHVRYVLDAPSLIAPETYEQRDEAATAICRAFGAAAGVVHFRDVHRSPEGELLSAAPGAGDLDYAGYVECVVTEAPADVPGIVRNVRTTEYAGARDYMLRLRGDWQLA
ncbi:MAG: TIM barrel protein [Chthonomonadales bacterium]|nr:TIM barrel protein [Chthonomonadales bacterium]